MWKLFMAAVMTVALVPFGPGGSPGPAHPGVVEAHGGWRTVAEPSHNNTPTSMSPDGRVWIVWGTYPPTFQQDSSWPPYHFLILGPGPGDQRAAEGIARRFVPDLDQAYVFFMPTGESCRVADHWMVVPTYVTATDAVQNLLAAEALSGRQASGLKRLVRSGDRAEYEGKVADLYAEHIVTEKQRDLFLETDFR